MSSLISLDIEFNEVRSFLSRVYSMVDSEYALLMAKVEAGEFTEEDDEVNAFFSPRTTEQIAMKAAINELNGIVEWELHGLANKPFSERQVNQNPKRLRFVWDLRGNNIRKLIEEFYGIHFESLPGYAEVECIREIANAFKHRKGYKDPRKDFDVDGSWRFGRLEINRSEIASCCNGARKFLRALKKACKVDS